MSGALSTWWSQDDPGGLARPDPRRRRTLTVELFYLVGINGFLVQSIIFLCSPRYRRQTDYLAISYWGNTTIGRGMVRLAPSTAVFMAPGGLSFDVDYFFGHQPNDPATKISEYLALFAVTFFFFGVSTALVNRPKFMVLKKHRDEPGMIQEYLTRWANRRNQPPKPPTRTTRHGQPPEPAEPEPSPTEPPPQPTHNRPQAHTPLAPRPPATRTGQPLRPGQLTIRRPRRWQDRFRAYTIVIDGEEVGRVRAGSTVTLPIAAGTHTVQLTIAWTGSNELELTINEADEVRLVVAPPEEATPGGLFDPGT